MSFLHDSDPPESPSASSSSGKWVAAVVAGILVAGAGGFYWMSRNESPAPEPEPEPVAEAPVPSPEPEPKAKAPRPARDAPTTGSLRVSASVDGASVFIDGERVGSAPFVDDAIDVGRYEVKVVSEGFREFVEEVRVRPGRDVSLRATLERLPPSLRVTSDVPGATVFLDRNYVGTTPVVVDDVAPGEHQLTVSAEGYEMHAETVSVDSGQNEVRVRFQAQASSLSESVPVVHKHRFGECEGRLVADTNGLRYESDHKDAFSVSFADVERFEIDYIEKNLNLKIRGGKNYNFTEKSGKPDPLFVFHKNVTDFHGDP